MKAISIRVILLLAGITTALVILGANISDSNHSLARVEFAIQLAGRFLALALAVAGVVWLLGAWTIGANFKDRPLASFPGAVCILAAVTLSGTAGWAGPLALGLTLGIGPFLYRRAAATREDDGDSWSER